MADVTPRRGLPDLADYRRFARRHRLVLVVFVGVGLLAGIALSIRQPSSYSATASITLTPVPMYVTVPSELLAPEVSIDTDAQLLSSPEVVAAIATNLGIDPVDVEERVSLTASANTRVLHVTVESGSPAAAAEAANAAVSALVNVRRTSLGALQDDQIRQLRLRLSDQEETLARTQHRRLVVPDTDELFLEVLALRNALDELEGARAEPVREVRPAVVPKRADYANTEVPVTSGAMLGLLAGCLFGAARDRGLLRAPARLHQFTVRHPVRPTAG